MKNSACRPVKGVLRSKGDRLTGLPRELTTLETVGTGCYHTKIDVEDL